MHYLNANWPAPQTIRALTTTRLGGISLEPYHSNNVGLHVADDATHVLANRSRLLQELLLPSEPAWLEQTHSNQCIVVEKDSHRNADAAVTRNKNQPLAIMTADCLPIVLCDTAGQEIAGIHAGWRGLAAGIIENTLAKMHTPPEHLLAWIGPAICVRCYQVGESLKQTFLSHYPFAQSAFHMTSHGLLADLNAIAVQVLNHAGINAVYTSNTCTYENPQLFYSARRAAITGRQVTFIWFC